MLMGPRNWFQGMNSANLCSLAGRYDNPIPHRFLAPIDFLKIPALESLYIEKPNSSDSQKLCFIFLPLQCTLYIQYVCLCSRKIVFKTNFTAICGEAYTCACVKSSSLMWWYWALLAPSLCWMVYITSMYSCCSCNNTCKIKPLVLLFACKKALRRFTISVIILLSKIH